MRLRFARLARSLAGLLGLGWLLLSVGCSPASERERSEGLSGKLVLTGSSTIAPLAMEIGQRFERLHPAVRVDVQTGGSSRGIADARSGAADIGMASRALKPGEQDLRSYQIAVDGICLIMHAGNPVEELSDAEVKAIYTGRIESWKALGGPDAEIVVAHKAEGRATLEVFLAYFQLDNAEIAADVIVGDNQQAIKTVAGNPHAIGYVSIAAAGYEARHGAPIKLLATGGVAPTPAAVAEGSFPITRPLNLVTRGAPNALAEAFLRYAHSNAIDDLVEAQHFVPLAR